MPKVKNDNYAATHYNSKLAQCRLKAKLTLKQVTELTGIDYRTLHLWESGKIKHPSKTNIKLLIVLAELYGITVNELENLIQDAYQHTKKGNLISCKNDNYIAKLIQYRYDSKLTIPQICKYTGINKYTLSSWEFGYVKRPNKKFTNNLKSLAELYKISINELKDSIEEAYNKKHNDTTKTTNTTSTKTNKDNKKMSNISKIELLELAYGEVSFKEFMEMIRIFS